MTKEELYKLTDKLNGILDNYLRGSEAEEVIAKFEDAVEKSGLSKEEPVSEDLEDTAKLHVIETRGEDIVWDENARCAMLDFKAGAKWQKEQFEKNRLKHCNSITNEQAELESDFIDKHLDKYKRIPTYLDAIEYGMRLQQEQMMKDAVECEIAVAYDNNYGGYTQLVDSKIPLATFGQKVKLIIIKED